MLAKPIRIEDPGDYHQQNRHQQYATPSPSSETTKVSSLVYNPNKLDLTKWTQPNSPSQQQQSNTANISISKDGVESLKARFYDPHQQQQQQQQYHHQQAAVPSQPQRVRPIKLSSHENYLFNNKNAVNALKNSTNQYYNNRSDFYDDDNIAASDL